MQSIKINTGLIRLEVDRDGEKSEITFNPNDINFVEGVYTLMSDLDAKQKEYNTRIAELESNDETDNNGIPLNIKERMVLVKELCLDLEKQIDMVFGTGTSEKAFGNALCFEMFEQFFEGITPYIQKARKEKLSKYQTKGARNVMR